MAGKKKVLVIKDVGGGLRGSTSGLRFNPRSGPELMEEDRSLGNDDPESRQRLEEKKEKDKEKREKKIAGLHHLSIRVSGKKRPEGDNQRDDQRLSELTGPASSTGYPLDVSSGARTGTGSAMGGAPVNVMTGEIDTRVSDILKAKAKVKEKGGRSAHHGKTHTIATKRTKSRTRRTKRLRRGRGKTSLDMQFSGKHVGNPQSRDPKGQSKVRHELTMRVGSSGGGPIKHGHSQRGRGARMMRRSVNPDPRRVHKAAEMSQAERDVPAHTSPMNLPSQQATRTMEDALAHTSGVRTHSPQATASDLTPSAGRAPQQSRVHRTHNVGGEMMPLGGDQGLASTGGMTGFIPESPTASMFQMSFNDLSLIEDRLMKAKLTDADISEFKWLVRELRKLTRSASFRKAGFEDAEHDDERPSANAHRKVTSSPTGATSVDPDDDPRYWGAHPIGLLLPRRGHQ